MNEYDLSQQLRARRRELRLSLSQLARRADTSAATLSRYENGWPRFEVGTLRKLAGALGCRLRVCFEPVEPRPARANKAPVVLTLQRLFWDRSLRKRDLEQYPLWVVGRVLEYGTLTDVRTLVAAMGRDRFLRYVARAPLRSSRTRALWQAILRKEGLTCTRKFSRPAAEAYLMR